MEELYGLLHHISNANKPMGSRIDAGRKLWVLHFGSESRLEATQESCQCLLWIGGDKKIAETLEHVVNYELEPAKYVASYLCNVVKNLAVYERKRQGDAPLLQKTVIIPIVKLFCMATHQKGRDAARSALRNLIGGQDMVGSHPDGPDCRHVINHVYEVAVRYVNYHRLFEKRPYGPAPLIA
jgi:hypothetical protein